MEKFKSGSGSLVPGDDMSTNLQTEQPAFTLFLPVYNCYAELSAEIQNPVRECRMVTRARSELSRSEGSLLAGALLNVAGCTLVQGENTGLLMTLMHCDIALFQAVHLLVLF